MTGQVDRHSYTTGGNKNLLHRRWIGSGGSGHVHEVFPRTKCLTSSFTISPQDRFSLVCTAHSSRKGVCQKVAAHPWGRSAGYRQRSTCNNEALRKGKPQEHRVGSQVGRTPEFGVLLY